MNRTLTLPLARFGAWFVHANTALLSLWSWFSLNGDDLQWPIALIFTALAIMTSPLLSRSGWNPIRSFSLCRNLGTWAVAFGLHLLVSAAFWSEALGRERYEAVYALVLLLSALMLARAYSDLKVKSHAI